MKSAIKLYFMAFAICYAFELNAQLSIEGNIENWSNGNAILAHTDMITGDIDSWGSIDAKGALAMQLAYDYMTIIKKKAEEAQKDAPKGWSMRFKTIGDTFVCSGFDNPLEYKNEATILTGVPELRVMSEDGNTEYGYLFMVSDGSIAKWLYSYGEDHPTTGYYLRWIYVEEAASVSGVCEMSTYTGNGEELYDDITSYNLKFEVGWNIVKYEITEVFNSASGKVFPLKTTVSVIQILPEDLQWVVLGGN